MKSKVVLGLLTVTGILALTSTVAQAGGGSPVPLTSFFVCHAITGGNLGKQVDVYSDEVGTPTTRTNVTIGQAILACAQAWLWPAGTQDPVPGTDINPRIPDPSKPPPSFKQAFELKCYSASGPGKKTGQTTFYSAEDVLFNGTEQVQGTPDVRYICGPSIFGQ